MQVRVPTTITYSGDRFEGKQHMGRARHEMAILEQLMSFQEGVEQDARTVTPYPGVVIQCWSSFKRRHINIYVKPKKDVVEIEPGYYECFCCSCFAIGKITDVYEGTGTTTEPTCSYYDVNICHGEKPDFSFVRFEGVTAVDYGMYEVDQLVMLGNMIDSDVDYCCYLEPVENADMCHFTEANITNEDAFPVIIPICLSSGESYSMWEKRFVLS